MKLALAVLAILLLILAWPALAATANNTTSAQNLTPVSISRNATISVPLPANATLAQIGSFENATVYISGGANATVAGDALAVDIGEAAWMDYRDVYLLYRLPPGFASVSFDYDLQAGEKSNVLLLDFADAPPKIGVKKGGIPDTAVLGLGSWTNTQSWIKGMNDIGGLKTFPKGAHHLEVVADSGMLYLKVDGNTTAYNFYSQKKYLVIHLMVGDEDSYLRGTLANLQYKVSPNASGTTDSGNTSGFIVPNMTLNGTANGSAGGQPGTAGDRQATPRPASADLKQAVGLNIWLALAAAVGFFVAWAIVYTKYIKR